LPQNDLQRYEAALAAGDRAAARTLVERLLEAGVAPAEVLTDVIAAAQRTVGIRWQTGEWTVAEEHAATALSVSSVQVVMQYVRRTPVTRGRVLIACAEREWHALPGMIIECALRADGWETTQLGASTTPMRFNQYLQDIGPDVVAVSCSMLGALSTTRRFIEASTAAGVPVVVGGAAFGWDDRRATALGATAWARDARGAVAAMRGLPAVVAPVPKLPGGPSGEQAALELEHRNLVAELHARWSPAAAADVDDALHQILHAVSAALLTGDPRPISHTVAWIEEFAGLRGIAAAEVRELGTLVAAVLRDYPQARALVDLHFAGGLTTD
jgi:MerR family transcriptional regulator, light-induced transcriptional regulator